MIKTKPLEMDPEEFRRIGYQAVDLAAQHLATIATRPVFQPMAPSEREALLSQALPEQGVPASEILAFIEEEIFRHPMGNGHPRFFGWVNSPPAMVAIVAELLAAALNPSCAGGDHAAIYLERCVVRWLIELVGWSTAGSMGLLVSGGSMASLTCLAAARHAAAKKNGWNVRSGGLQGRTRPLVMYLSSEGHSCLRKAAELLGLGEQGVRIIPVDDQFHIDLRRLREAIERDRAEGFTPFCVVGNAGTVNSGAIDPLEGLADLCSEQDLWFHVDGAYGAIAVLDPAVAARYRGLERADSLALDPHKWLSVPVECGCALVRDGTLLRDAFSLVPSYLRTEEGKGFGGLPWYSEYGFQQSRGFRALKLWATLRHAGRSGLRTLIRNHNRLARLLATRIDAVEELERLAPVELSIVCFRYVPRGSPRTEEELNTLNQRIMEAVQSEGEAFVSGTVLVGKFALRACVLHYGTTEQDLEALLAAVIRTGLRLG
jgi:glutamate/tyrosine decarboxylase-like PLP-dependent enzyme